MFAQLINEVSWQQRSDKIDGKSYLQPRLTAWFGDLPYSYSGITWQPNVVNINNHYSCLGGPNYLKY